MSSHINPFGMNFPIGAHHHRAFVGPPEKYDVVSAVQFNLLTFLGLRQEHFLLDIGCGSLRAGRLLIPYLLPGHYFGIEPEAWLLQEGIDKEIGRDLLTIKQPHFSHVSNFALSSFDQEFDFILAHSIFSHASQSQIKQCLSEARKVMKTSSFFVATFVKGKQDYPGDTWVYPECVTYTLECLINFAAEQGMICKSITWPHPNEQTWVIVAHPANERNIPSLTGNIQPE